MFLVLKCHIVQEVTQLQDLIEFGIRSLRTFCILTIMIQYLFAFGLWLTNMKEIWPSQGKKVWACLPETICQRHESKMLKVIKMSKTVPILCPGSVDIKSHIIESR